jgi:8-oxo-dGTP diphosphatase
VSAAAVHVLVGLIADGAGRWLVNERRAGTHMAGHWEFPGGKRQEHEEPFAALKRELEEELGIDVQQAEPLLELVHDYPDKRVRLDVWLVQAYSGNVIAREGQALKWASVEECRDLPLLAADAPILQRLEGLFASPAGSAQPYGRRARS